MVKLVVAYIAEGDEDCWKISYDSIKDVADHIVIVNGNIPPYNNRYPTEHHELHKSTTIIDKPYPHKEKGADGKQRNSYLEYIKKYYPDSWTLVLDCDEVVSNAELIKPMIEKLEEQHFDSCNPFMRHLIGDFAHEDATVPYHTCPGRLFKVNPNLSYPEVEHPVIMGGEKYAIGSDFVIWHLGKSREAFRLLEKYNNNLLKSNMHNDKFLTWWYHAHLFGTYPVKPVPPEQLPRVLKDHFKVNDDHLYFRDRMQPELKHWEDAKTWISFFKPKNALEVGCGAGHRTRALLNQGVDAYGFDVSKWAVDNSPYPELTNHLAVRNLLEPANPEDPKYDLVILYDVLEHIDEKDIDKAIGNFSAWSNKNILVSVPMVGDPNLANDSTHRIFWTRDQWASKFAEHRLAIVPTPEYFHYKHQLFCLEKQS